jgi:ubiquinone/menaquinone biosynthesis C-methylase UbiE
MQVNTTYEPFSQQAEYIETNREFLKTLPLGTVTRALDLACGTGTLTEILFEIQPKVGVIGIDISSESLNIGRDIFRKRGLLVEDQAALESAVVEGRGGVLFLEGSADDLPFKPGSIDFVMMGNSIHMLPDKKYLLSAIHRVLRPGGIFAFNSAFFVGTYPEGTEHVYTEWVKEAMLFILEKDEELKRNGHAGVTRERGKGKKAFNKGWMASEEWVELLEQTGFGITHNYLRTMIMTQESFETVGAYSGFSEVMMSGYPIDLASEALQEGAKRAFTRLDIEGIPRLWLEIAATKQ